jgi:hypothetical protein
MLDLLPMLPLMALAALGVGGVLTPGAGRWSASAIGAGAMAFLVWWSGGTLVLTSLAACATWLVTVAGTFVWPPLLTGRPGDWPHRW